MIKCPCGQYKDEGVMVQCEKCQIWQHTDCVGAVESDEAFFCEECSEKKLDLDIPIFPQPEYASPGEKYFVSLMRDDMQVRLGDTVYVLRAFKTVGGDATEPQEPSPPAKEAAPSPKTNEEEAKQGISTTTESLTTSQNSESSPSKDQRPTNGPSPLPTPCPLTPEGKGAKETAITNNIDATANPNSIEESKSPDEGVSPVAEKNEEDASETKRKEFNQGGIPHTMMSPSKGPSLASSSLAKGNYPTYKTVSADVVSTTDMDILRIERLWMNENGERFAFGHHYLRPHETYHEPSRKFYHNEVFRVPIYEVLPLDTIWRQCWVLDVPTFCKGRPVGAVEEHVYICEYRVDKGARLFNKIAKPKHVVCTKKFAFDSFDQRLKPSRNYAVS